MDRPIFVYGTLRDADVLALALGPARARVTASPAQLPGHAAMRAEAGPFPALRPMPGATAPGLLLEPGDADVRARLDFFEGAFDFALVPVEVVTQAGPRKALVYWPGGEVADTGRTWELADWQQSDKPLFLEMAREVMALDLDGPARAAQRNAILRRALARLNARADAAPAALRSDFGATGVADHRVERLHSGFFALEEHRFRHRTFDGGLSREVTREVFVTGDAVSVLPWDPRTDRVLLIEQIRAGLIGRGDPNPWNLEVIAGLRDRPEPAEAAARRETLEEAGLVLGRLERVAGYYTTPGVVSEFVTSFIGEADLANHSEGLHGLDAETEDIRTLIVPREEAMAALARGEARNAPLVISLMALERERARLAALWSG